MTKQCLGSKNEKNLASGQLPDYMEVKRCSLPGDGRPSFNPTRKMQLDEPMRAIMERKQQPFERLRTALEINESSGVSKDKIRARKQLDKKGHTPDPLTRNIQEQLLSRSNQMGQSVMDCDVRQSLEKQRLIELDALNKNFYGIVASQ